MTVSAMVGTAILGAEQAGLGTEPIIRIDEDGAHPSWGGLLGE
ncbi:hypothetical protein [Nesterenkonia suensis]